MGKDGARLPRRACLIAMQGNAAPLRFVAIVIGAWIATRGAMLIDWQADRGRLAAFPSFEPSAEAATPPIEPERMATRSLPLAAAWRPPMAAPAPGSWIAPENGIGARKDERVRAEKILLIAAASPNYHHATGATEAAMAAGPASKTTAASHWSGSAWAFVRGGGRATALSPGGQIGGGQAGANLLYRVDGGLSASARISHTIGGARQSEAALGIDWKPLPSIPVHILADRRIAIDKGGRNAWTLGAAGGVYALPLGGSWRLDGYAEAGVVGAKRRDLYADGALRVARAIDLGEGRSLAFGGGVWGAAQPGASRIDVGPSAVLRLPIEGRTVAVALDWRQRVTGDAKPGSGVALTLGIDF
jgi:hypothetical protein